MKRILPLKNNSFDLSFLFKIFLTFQLLLISAAAQTQTTDISGVVVDPNGAVVVNASVTLINKATGTRISTVTDDQGAFLFKNVQPGNYDIEVTSTGFKTETITNLTVSIAKTERVTITLAVGGTQEPVSVLDKVSTAEEPDSFSALPNINNELTPFLQVCCGRKDYLLRWIISFAIISPIFCGLSCRNSTFLAFFKLQSFG